MNSAISYLEEAISILNRDEARLERIDAYYNGVHDAPYMPDGANAEYHLLAKRATTNWMQLLVDTPCQALYVDNFRRSEEMTIDADISPEWKHWQESRLDARQGDIYRAALEFGQSYVLTEKDKKGRVISRGLSPLRTVTLYEDPAFDLDPWAAVYVKRFPIEVKPETNQRGLALVWDETHRYEIEFDEGDLNPRILSKAPHGAGECPVTRFTAYLDLEGRSWGVVEPLIEVQNRFNQTIFDLLMAQTYTAFEVRTVTGMAPPFEMEMNEDNRWVPKLDDNNQPIPAKTYLNASRMLYAEDKDVEFKTLPGGDLAGFIAAAELAMRHISAISQTPPHHLLGQIANVSAEALQAAETALSRKVENFRSAFSESWERVFRLALAILGEPGADDYLGEVVWRDLGTSSLAQTADALGKFGDSLDIPKQGLWTRVPGVTRQELKEWSDLRTKQDQDMQLMAELQLKMQQAAKATQQTGASPASGTATRYGAVNDTAKAA